ncbi:MAG: excisionase family DNA-binding protein [Geminicoccaceae bacterium]
MAEPAKPFTVGALAEHWDCSRSHVYNLIQRGEVRCIKVGRLVRIPRHVVAAIDRGEEWQGSGDSTGPEAGTSSGRKTGVVREFQLSQKTARTRNGS